MQIKPITYFYPEAPKLTTIENPMIQKMSDDPAWIAESKRNGRRLILHRLPNGDLRYYNRHGAQMSYRPNKALNEALHDIPWPKGYCILDGELRHDKVPGIKHRISFFDLFVFNGELLNTISFLDRRSTLADFVPNCEPVLLENWYMNDFEKTFHVVTKDPEIEGLVFKNLNGMLNLGRNNRFESKWMWKARRPSGMYRQ